MNKREAMRTAHRMAGLAVQCLLNDCVREERTTADLLRVDAALDQIAQRHFELGHPVNNRSKTEVEVKR